MAENGVNAKTLVSIGGITVLILVAVFIFQNQLAHPMVNPHISSAPYVWPQGCGPTDGPHDPNNDDFQKAKPSQNLYYGVLDKIPKSCMVPQNYFTDAAKYNFPSHKGNGQNYYRVGNDAINFDCFDDVHCIASNVVKDVFIVDRN